MDELDGSAGFSRLIEDQGDTWRYTLSEDADADLSDWTFSMQVRERQAPDSTLVVEFDVDMSGAASSEVVFEVADTDSADVSAGVWWWELEAVTPSGERRTLRRGPFEVRGEVIPNG